MNRDYIKQDLAHLLETISEQVENVYIHENKIPQIEIDILLKNVQRFYEQLIALDKLNKNEQQQFYKELPRDVIQPEAAAGTLSKNKNTATEITSSAEPEKNIEQPMDTTADQLVSPSEKIEIAVSEVKGENIAPEPPAIVLPPAEVISAEPEINIQEEAAVKVSVPAGKSIPKKVSKTAASLFDAAPSLAEQFDDGTTIKEKLNADKKEKSVAETLHQQKIPDLKKVIGINEKFLFINELFEGSLTSYNEHIDKLNNAPDINHARSIVDSLIAKYGWEGNLPIVKNFTELVERRFL